MKANFFQKKEKKKEVRREEVVNEEDAIKNILSEQRVAFKAVSKALLMRYMSMADYWQFNYHFRYNILDHNASRLREQKKTLFKTQERCQQDMQDKYGMKTANFLHGETMNVEKEKFLKRERNRDLQQMREDAEIETSEEKMFLNSFSFAKRYLESTEDVSLITLGPYVQGKYLGYDNVGFRQWYHYQMSFLDIQDLILSECTQAIGKISPFLEGRFQKSCADLIRAMLDEMLKLFNCRVTNEQIIEKLPIRTPKVLEIMKKKVPILTETVDREFRKKIESQLIELKIAYMLSKYYRLIGNWEKSYVLLFSAYRQTRGVSQSHPGRAEIRGLVRHL